MPHHLVPRLGSACPHSGIAPWAAAKGHPWPSAAIPASMPGCPLHNACVRPAWLTGRRDQRPARGGLVADLALPVVRPSDLLEQNLWEQSLRARRPYSRPGSPARTPIPLWERACSRRRRHSQHHSKLIHRFREQARSHMGLAGVHSIPTRHKKPVGAGLLAKASAQPTSQQTDLPLSRAGSLPHGVGGCSQHLHTTQKTCGSEPARDDASTANITAN